MGATDLEAVLALENRIYPFPWTLGNFSDSLASGYSAWLIKVSGSLIGYALMMQAHDEAQLLNLGVAPERRRSGFGSALLVHLLAQARAFEATRMLLEVRRSNGPALALYHHHGFVLIGARRDYYPAQQGREDALVLAKSI